MVVATKKVYNKDKRFISEPAPRAKTTDNATNHSKTIYINDYLEAENEFSFKTNGASKDNQDAVKLHGVLRDSIASIDFELIDFENWRLGKSVFNNLLYILSQIPDVSDEYEYNANLRVNVKKANPDLLEINKYINYAYYCIANNDEGQVL